MLGQIRLQTSYTIGYNMPTISGIYLSYEGTEAECNTRQLARETVFNTTINQIRHKTASGDYYSSYMHNQSGDLTITGKLGVGGDTTMATVDIYANKAASNMLYLANSNADYGTVLTFPKGYVGEYGSGYAGTVCGMDQANLFRVTANTNSGLLLDVNEDRPIVLATSGVERARVTTTGLNVSGKVGIGCTPSMGTLDVYADKAESNMIYLANANTDYGSLITFPKGYVGEYGSGYAGTVCGMDQANLFRVTANTNSGMLLDVNEDRPIVFATSGVERARLNTTGLTVSGKVGVGGSCSMSNALDVYTDSASSNTIYLQNINTDYGTLLVFPKGYMGEYGSGYAGTVCGMDQANLFRVTANTNSGMLLDINEDRPIVLATSGIERVRIDSTGLTVTGEIYATNTSGTYIVPRWVGIPGAYDALGSAGEIAIGSGNDLFVCTGTNRWVVFSGYCPW
jgi:hypothetical protein